MKIEIKKYYIKLYKLHVQSKVLYLLKEADYEEEENDDDFDNVEMTDIALYKRLSKKSKAYCKCKQLKC